jgi:hypothetical protein
MSVVPGPASQDAVIKLVLASPGLQRMDTVYTVFAFQELMSLRPITVYLPMLKQILPALNTVFGIWPELRPTLPNLTWPDLT